MRSAQTFELMTFRHLATTLIPVPVARIALAAGGACELTGMPEAGNGDMGLFQALPGPHSPKLVRYSPTGDSHWATDTTAGRISREVMERDSSNKISLFVTASPIKEVADRDRWSTVE